MHNEEFEPLFFARSGLQHTLIRQLKTGKVRPTAELDLHGMSIYEAEDALLVFIKKPHRCVRIIHGKGKAILRNHIKNLLQELSNVLAFSSAIPKDGGTGALYVLLRKTAWEKSELIQK